MAGVFNNNVIFFLPTCLICLVGKTVSGKLHDGASARLLIVDHLWPRRAVIVVATGITLWDRHMRLLLTLLGLLLIWIWFLIFHFLHLQNHDASKLLVEAVDEADHIDAITDHLK